MKKEGLQRTYDIVIIIIIIILIIILLLHLILMIIHLILIIILLHLRSTGQPGSGRNLGSRPLVLEGAKSWLLLSGSGLEAEDLIMRRSPIIVMLIKKNTFCLCSFDIE